MATPLCSVCAWLTTGQTIDSLLSNTAIAKFVGVTESSVRRHWVHAPKATPPSDEFLRDLDIPIEAVTSRGASIRDPETGSWQKVTWHPNAKALSDTLKYDDLRAALEGWEPVGPSRRTHGDYAEILNMADLQIGKAMQRGGGTPETLARVRQAVARFVEDLLSRTELPSVIAIVDNGDPIENCFNVPSQLVTNDLPVPEQIRVFRRLVLETIKALAKLSIRLIYVCVPSNHGAARVGYKSPGGTVDADFGLEISYQLEDAISENPHLAHVEFVRPRSLDETAELTVAGTKLAFHHGHQSSGPTSHGKWWAGQDHGRMAGWDADILVVAHYHSLRLEQSGDGRWIIGVSSSDASSDWFTNRTGESAIQGLTAFSVRDGQWSNLRIV